MKLRCFLIALLLCRIPIFSQEVIALPSGDSKGTLWENPEKQYFSKIWQTQVVTNVSEPTMQVFRPSSEKNTGTAVIVAPGGGLFALSINSEGNDVGAWLADKGITAFVLKYRLVPTGDDGVEEIMQLGNSNPQKMFAEVAKVMPLSIQDGLHAVTHARENAEDYGIDPNKIGFMGFSAGGAVTMGVTYAYTETSKPNFIVPVYYWSSAMPVQELKNDAPNVFIVCATDDPLDLAEGSIKLYESFLEAEKPVALQMYAKGGHGFGMKEQGLPSDQWIERFYEWALAQGITTSLGK